MPSKLKQNWPFIVGLILCFILYFPILDGTPIWDDHFFLFDHPIKDSVSYLQIVKDFAWPVSVVFHKFLYQVFGTNYFAYHLVSFILHGLNAYLILKVLRYHKIKGSSLITILFLLHPANLMSVAWIIQSKTLLSFFFGISSYLIFLKSTENEKKRIPLIVSSSILLILSCLAKPASALLPVLYLFILWRKELLRPYMPVIVITAMLVGFGATRTYIRSQEIVQNSQVVDQQKISLLDKAIIVTKTTQYYALQSLSPARVIPLQGRVSVDFHYQETLFLILLVILLLLAKSYAFILYFFAGLFMMLPFLGIIYAPFMRLTWVSDQHLYLALPFFLIFLVKLLQTLPKKFFFTFAGFISLAFFWVSYSAMPTFKNDISFFETSYSHAPENSAIVLNLITSYLNNGQVQLARKLAHDFLMTYKDYPGYLSDENYISIFLMHSKLEGKLQQ